jgi:transposase InsO family protein
MARNTCRITSRKRLPSWASRVRPPFRAPEGNGCAERFIRTLKENLLWVRTLTIEDLRQAFLVFRDTYNTTWLIKRHGFITPGVFRQKQLQTATQAA